MKKLSIPLNDLLIVLEALRDDCGTTNLLVSEQDGYLCLADENDPENIVSFRPENEEVETNDDGESLH